MTKFESYRQRVLQDASPLLTMELRADIDWISRPFARIRYYWFLIRKGLWP